MANKFIGLDDAAKQLGLSKERLNEIRESGKVRAYRDGTSWKFRTEDIDGLEGDTESLSAEASGIDLEELSLGSSELSSLSLELDPEPSAPPAEQSATSDLDLDTIEDPTVSAEPDEISLDLDEPLGGELSLDDEDDGESILLSEDELGDSIDRPPSTIIGRSQLEEDPASDDLNLAASPEDAARLSDVRLADDEAINDVIAGADKPTDLEKFEDLEELDIDLEAESSRILEAQDVAAAQQAAKKMAEASDDDLQLAGSSLTLDTESGTNVEKPGDVAALSGSGEEELELELTDSSVVGSGLELQEDGSDNLVLDSSDDDFSLSAADSGINLKPSDSGLALDDDSFALGGSAVGSSLDLGDSLGGDSFAIGGSGASEVSLEGSTAFSSSPDFNLQPADDEDDEDEEDSSQIIALDAIEETDEGLEDEGSMLTGASSITAGAPMAAVGMEPSPVVAQETAFPLWIVAFLGLSAMLMTISGIMANDILRSMWAWDESTTLQSPLIQAFLGLIGLGG